MKEDVARMRAGEELAALVRRVSSVLAEGKARGSLSGTDTDGKWMSGMREHPRDELGTPEHSVGTEPLAVVRAVLACLTNTELARRNPEHVVSPVVIAEGAGELLWPRVVVGR